MKKNSMFNRREALKVMGLGSGLLLGGMPLAAQESQTILSHPASHKHARIVIVGGGTAGMIAVARTRRAAPNAQIVLIAPNELHRYQPGALFVAAGMATAEEYIRKSASLVPDDVKWLKEKVISFDPENNLLIADKSGKIIYDILIVALGAKYDYEEIDGLKEDMIGKNGIASLYMGDSIDGNDRGGDMTRLLFNKLLKDTSTKNKPLKILFSEPPTPVKGAGTSLSLLFLYNHILKKVHKKKDVTFTYITAHEKLLEFDKFDVALKKELKKHTNIKAVYGKKLVGINVEEKKATFAHDNSHEEIGYDLLHITPPIVAPKVMRDSLLALKEGAQKGWMEVDPSTLRHPKYKNVFGLGDVINIPYAKSGGAAQQQGIILQDNIAAALEGEKLTYHYNGYTVAPVVTAYGKVLLSEYNNKKALPTFFLSPYEPRIPWWLLQRYFMPWAYFNLMMRGMM